MSIYRHILVGLDLSEESQQVLDRVKSLSDSETKLTLMHVQEPLSFAYGGDIPLDLSEVQSQIEEQAEKGIDELVKQMQGFSVVKKVILGQPTHEMHRYAEENDVDLIVVGSHGRHGLALLAGSTANGVVHGASCDVLAVRIKSAT